MGEEKMNIIKKSAEQYKKLPADKKMFVLGVMQGILLNSEQQENQAESKNIQKLVEMK